MLELRNDALGLRLLDLELLEALEEVLVLQRRVLVHLLLEGGDVEFEDLARVLEDLAVQTEGALDVEVEDEVVVLEGEEVEGADVALDHEVEREG